MGKQDKICQDLRSNSCECNLWKIAFLSVFQDIKQTNKINIYRLLIHNQMVPLFRTYTLIYQQSKVCHFQQCNWLLFVYALEKLAVLTSRQSFPVYSSCCVERKRLYITNYRRTGERDTRLQCQIGLLFHSYKKRKDRLSFLMTRVIPMI